MAHGHPDYGLDTARETVHTVTDLGELAARLGSIDVFDRSGEVIYADGFESGIGSWVQGRSGAGAAVEWSAEEKLHGGFSAKLTGGSNLLRYADITRELSVPVMSRIGIEESWTEEANLDRAEFFLTIYTGFQRLVAGYYYDAVLLTNNIWVHPGVWQVLGPPITTYKSHHLFYTTKVVVDLVNGVYVKAIGGPYLTPLTGIPVEVAVDPALARMEIRGRVYSIALTNAIMYWDNLIVTQNEP